MIWHNWNVIWLLLIDEPILIGGITWTSVTWAFCSFPRAAASSWNECKSRFLLMKCQDIHLLMLDLRGTSHKKAEAHFASTIYCNMFILWWYPGGFGMYLLLHSFCWINFRIPVFQNKTNASWSMIWLFLWTYVTMCLEFALFIFVQWM